MYMYTVYLCIGVNINTCVHNNAFIIFTFTGCNLRPPCGLHGSPPNVENYPDLCHCNMYYQCVGKMVLPYVSYTWQFFEVSNFTIDFVNKYC